MADLPIREATRDDICALNRAAVEFARQHDIELFDEDEEVEDEYERLIDNLPDALRENWHQHFAQVVGEPNAEGLRFGPKTLIVMYGA
jgi:hypothetical protein